MAGAHGGRQATGEFAAFCVTSCAPTVQLITGGCFCSEMLSTEEDGATAFLNPLLPNACFFCWTGASLFRPRGNKAGRDNEQPPAAEHLSHVSKAYSVSITGAST